LAGVLAAAANSTIVPQRGIAGVSIGMSKKKVRAILGKPRKVVQKMNVAGPFTEYQYRALTVDFQNGRVLTDVSTTRRHERTASGVGVGSTKSEVQKAVHGVSCNGAVCKVGKSRPGKIVTTFYLSKSGKVILVAVGRVID